MTPLMTLAFLTHWTPLIHEGRLGEGPAVAPRRYRWTVVRLIVDCSFAIGLLDGDPQSLFDLEYFLDDPEPFYCFAH